MATPPQTALLNLVHVVISSTTLDLPRQRRAALDGVWHSSMRPVAMERDRIALYNSPLDYSYELVDEAHVYIGIFGNRYGFNPPGYDVSITELEYRRAVARQMPILIFFAKDDAPLAPDDTEYDMERGGKLQRLKAELSTRYKVAFFTSPEDLQELVSESLDALVESDKLPLVSLRHLLDERGQLRPVPVPPEPYYFHRYTLENRFVGRAAELATLDAWGRSADSVLVIEAIGGMGKSALTWYWARERARLAIPGMRGLLWFSFYEGDATMGVFQRHVLSYLTGVSLKEIEELVRPERERLLFDALRRTPVLIVLDGIERLLNAYTRTDAMHMSDADVGANGKDDTVHPRRCADPRDREFLRKLGEVAPSKILISTRLVPEALQSRGGQNLLPGMQLLSLSGLQPRDVVDLFHALEVHGDARQMQQLAARFGNHALLVQVVAGYINAFPEGPGDFDAWYADEGRGLRFPPWQDLATKQENVLAYAFKGLLESHRSLLSQIATFRFPVDYRVLQAINPFARAGSDLIAASRTLNQALNDLVERGLAQWDRLHNRYDLHPIVRAYAFGQLDEQAQRRAYGVVRGVFEVQPPEDPDTVLEVSDLRNTIELYQALVGAGLLDEAARLYSDRLNAILYQLSAYPTDVELLTPLFPRGLDRLPALTDKRSQSNILNVMAYSCAQTGADEQAKKLMALQIKLELDRSDMGSLNGSVSNYVNYLSDGVSMGAWLHAVGLLQDLAQLSREPIDIVDSHFRSLAAFVATGQWVKAEQAYQSFLAAANLLSGFRYIGMYLASVERIYAWMLLQQGQPVTSRLEHSWEMASQIKDMHVKMLIRKSQGEDALILGDPIQAEERFAEALSLAARMGMHKAEFIVGIARAQTAGGRHDEARATLAALPEETPRAGSAVDLAEVWLGLGELRKARELALQGYREAWSDGPPAVFWWPLQRAKKILEVLNEPEPSLRPFDPRRITPLPYEREIREFMAKLKKQQ